MSRFARPILVITMFATGIAGWIPHASAGSQCARHDERGPVERFERHAEAIGLEEAQLEEMRSLAGVGASHREALHGEIRDASHALHALMVSDTPDEAAVLERVEEIGRLETQKRVDHTRLSLALRKILTPDQREQMRTQRSPHHRRHGQPHAGESDGAHPHGSECEGSCEGGSCKHGSCRHGKHGSADESAYESGGECPHARAVSAREVVGHDR